MNPHSSPSHAPARVLFIDGDFWEPFGQLAAAVAQHGVVSDHVTAPPRHLQSRFSQALERRLFDRTSTPVVRPGRDGGGASVNRIAVATWVEASTVDIQARDDLGHQLLVDDPDTFAGLRKAHALPFPEHIYDKAELTAMARTWGVSVPRTWPASDCPTATPERPLVLKAPVGFGGQAVVRVTNPDQHRQHSAEMRALGVGEPIAQEFVGEQKVNVGGVAEHGRLLIAASYQPLPDPHDPYGPPRGIRLHPHPHAVESAAVMVAQSGFHGMFTIDFVLDPVGTPHFVDFNPRAFGAWGALQSLGVDLVGAYLRVLGVGDGPRSHPQPSGPRWAPTLGPPPPAGPLLPWIRTSRTAIAGLRPWLGTTWAAQAWARVSAYSARHLIRSSRGLT